MQYTLVGSKAPPDVAVLVSFHMCLCPFALCRRDVPCTRVGSEAPPDASLSWLQSLPTTKHNQCSTAYVSVLCTLPEHEVGQYSGFDADLTGVFEISLYRLIAHSVSLLS